MNQFLVEFLAIILLVFQGLADVLNVILKEIRELIALFEAVFFELFSQLFAISQEKELFLKEKKVLHSKD